MCSEVFRRFLYQEPHCSFQHSLMKETFSLRVDLATLAKSCICYPSVSSSTHQLVMMINKIYGLPWIIRRHLNPICSGSPKSVISDPTWLLPCHAIEALHAFAFPLSYFHLLNFILWTILRTTLGLLLVGKKIYFLRSRSQGWYDTQSWSCLLFVVSIRSI